jgi:hypothetical protein
MKKINLLFIGILFISIVSCSKDEQQNNITTVVTNETTAANSETTFTSIKISGKIIAEDGNTISSRGVCWGTNLNPTIENNIATTETNIFNLTITNLTANTTYYFRIYAIDSNGVIYSENESFSTLSLENTVWKFSSYYSPNNFLIESTVNFYSDGTTKFDEIGVGQGFFITYGTWSLNGNLLTYRWNSADPNNPEYLYTGIISGSTMSGDFSHPSIPGTWNAIQL